MNTIDKVIVTLNIQNESIDMELPCFLPMKDLKNKLIETLNVIFQNRRIRINNIQLIYNNTPLMEEDTLASRGIWNGSYIECRI